MDNGFLTQGPAIPPGMAGPLVLRSTFYDVAVATIAPCELCAAGCCTLFLLPGGRPRASGSYRPSSSEAGLDRRPRPRARRSRPTIASSICSRSAFNSARILLTSITITLPVDLAPAKVETAKGTGFPLPYIFLIFPQFVGFTRNKFIVFVIIRTIISTGSASQYRVSQAIIRPSL